MIKKFNLVISCSLLIIVSLIACNPAKKLNKDYLYFQKDKDSIASVQLKELTIQPNDLLSIQVYSKSINQEQAAIFNIPNEKGYLVGAKGEIDLPVIGEMKVSGLTRSQLQATLQSKLRLYVKDPSVIIRFQQLKINVLGEVNSPGAKTFATDRITILDAISESGDLTQEGVRQNVMVIREEENGIRKIYEVDLRSASLFQSPVYQLKQNDVVYVSASNKKLKQLKEKKETLKGVQLGVSLLTAASTLYLLFSR